MANGKPSRDEMLKMLGKPSPQLQPSANKQLPTQKALESWMNSQSVPIQRKKDSNPIFDIPILGPVLDFIDTPRAAIVSGIKEFGDIFDDDESFSIAEWADQTHDNIFMGDVLREWGVDLPGPLDFALGLGLDIAFDPLTYMLPMGAWARMGNKWKVADNLMGAAATARRAKDFSKALKLEKAAANVTARGVYAAGKEALEEIGLDTAVKFSIPLSGRLGQAVFERPLRMIPGVNAKWGKWMDARRVKQLGQVNVGPGGKWAATSIDDYRRGITRGFDIANPNNQQKVLKQVNALNSSNRTARKELINRLGTVARGGATGTRGIKTPQLAHAALTAAQMPVEIGFRIPQGFGVLAAVAGVPGKVMGSANKIQIIETIGKGLSTNYELNQLWRSGDPTQMNTARWMEVIANSAETKGAIFKSKYMNELAGMGEEAKKIGIDFDTIFRAANERMETSFAAAIDPRFGPRATGGQKAAKDLVKRLNKWFDNILEDFNNALPYREDLEALANELYVTRQMSKQDLDLVGGKNWFGEGSGLTGSPFKNRELHLPESVVAARKAKKISEEEVARIVALWDEVPEDVTKMGQVFDDGIRSGRGVEVRAEDGQIYRTKFLGEGFKEGRDAGSVLTQMDEIGKRVLGSDYRKLFTEDSVAALTRYLEQMVGQVRGQAIVGDLAQYGVIFKASDNGVINAAGRKLQTDIRNQLAKRDKKLNRKIQIEKRTLKQADTIANYSPEEALEVVQSIKDASRGVKQRLPGGRTVKPEIDLPTSYPPRSVQEIYEALPKNQKGRAEMRGMLEEPVVAEYAANEDALETVNDVLVSLIRGDATNITEKGRLLLTQGVEALPHPSGRFAPNVPPAVGPDGTPYQVHAQRLVDATEEDIRSAVEFIGVIEEELTIINRGITELQTNFQGLEDIAGMRENFASLQEFAQENVDFINSITSNFVRNVLENVTSVQAAKFMDELGKGSFGDVVLFSTRKASPEAERSLDIQNRWLNRLEQNVVNAQLIDLDVGSGGLPMEWWEAYKAANPNWKSTSTVRPSISGRKVVLRDVGEQQMENFQQFTDDWLKQKGGSPPARKPAKKIGQEPPNWSGALGSAENWPAQFVDDLMEIVRIELTNGEDTFIKFSTGPRTGKGQKVRATDGALREYRGLDFTISKGSGSEWQVVVDGQTIPISGPRARASKAGEDGLVLWLPNQQRLIRFNPTPRKASMATGVTASKNKQALAVAKRISARIDDAAGQRLRNIEYREGLRDEALSKQAEWRVKAEALLEKKVNVFEEYRLAQYGKRTVPVEGTGTPAKREIVGTTEFAPQPVGRQTISGRKWFLEPRRIGYGEVNVPVSAETWTGRVVDEVEVRIPAREGPALTPPKVPPKDPRRPAPVMGEDAMRLKDGTYVIDIPWGTMRVNQDVAAAFDAARTRQHFARQQGTTGRDDVGGVGRARTVERSGTTEVKEVFAVNVYNDEMLVYKNPRKGHLADRYTDFKGDWGPEQAQTFVSGEGQPLVYVRPAPDDVRMQSSLEGGLWDVVDVRPGQNLSPHRLEGTYAGQQLKSRLQSRGWVFLDDVDAVRALEDGTYVVPPVRALRGTTGAEKAAIERVFNDPLYRGWVERVQEATRLEDELVVVRGLRYSTHNSTRAAKEEMLLRQKQAVQDVVNAKANALEDQIELGVTGPSYAIGGSKSPTAAIGVERNRKTVAALLKRAESLDSMTEEGLQRMDEIHRHMETVIKPWMRAKDKVVKLSDEEPLAIINAHYVEQAKVHQQMDLDYQNTLREARGDTAKSMDVAETQTDALKILQQARINAGFTAAYDELVEDYVMHASTFGKNTEKSSGISSRTRQHLNGYQLVEASDETVELFEAAFQSMAKLRDPHQSKIFGKRYGQLLNYWKAQAVATSGFVFRNMMGGTWINNQIAGVPVGTQIRVDRMRQIALKRAAELGHSGDVAWGARDIAKGKQQTKLGHGLTAAGPEEWHTFSMWTETGMANTGITSMEVRNAVNERGSSLKEYAKTPDAYKFWTSENILFSAVGRFNQRAEFSLRGALAHHIMMNGGTREEAFQQIYKYHFDYSNLTHWDQQIKQVIPFWTWQKNILPVLIESFGTNPKLWGRLVQVKGELELTSEEEGLVPHYFGENMGIRLPFSTGGNRVYALPDLPFKDLSRYLKSPTAPARGLVESAMPFYKLPIEIWAGKRTFADIPFTGRYQQVPHSIRLLPGLMPFLSVWGKAKKNERGEWKMRDQDIYAIEQFMPILGRARRLVPNESAKQERLITTYASFLFGLGLRTNTPSTKRGQLIQDKIKHSQDMRDARDIMGRNI